jgi:hypothetical protein
VEAIVDVLYTCQQARWVDHASSVLITLRPLYEPQLGQAWWGSAGSPQSGQVAMAGAVRLLPVLRLSRRDLDIFLFGKPMSNLLTI